MKVFKKSVIVKTLGINFFGSNSQNDIFKIIFFKLKNIIIKPSQLLLYRHHQKLQFVQGLNLNNFS